MLVKRIVTGKWRENTYVVYNAKKDCIVIDAGAESRNIIDWIRSQDLNVHAILSTHAHYDHVGAVAALQREFKAPFYLHSKERRGLKRANFYLKLMHKEDPIEIPNVDIDIDKIDNPMQFESLTVSYFDAPGHSEGGVCFQIDSNLFTGDSLFENNIGRTDLPGGNKKHLNETIHRINQFGKDTVIYPGHGEKIVLHKLVENNSQFKEVVSERTN